MSQAYSALKLNAIAELEEVTVKGDKSINTAVMISTTAAIAEIKNDYESTLTEWDKAKAELDLVTQQTRRDIKYTIDGPIQVTGNVSQITKDVKETK